MKQMAIGMSVAILLLASLAFAGESVSPEVNKDTSGYHLQEIIAIALQNNPRIQGLKLELQAADARIIQSALWSNPVFTAESENFSGDLPGFNYTENTFSLEQPLLLGGKRKLQKKLAEQERLILKHQYEAEKIELIRDVEHGVYHVLVSQKVLEHTRETQEIAGKLCDFIKGKIDLKDTEQSRHELLSAQIELSQAELEISHAERALEIAKNNLIIMCGGEDIFRRGVIGDLDRKFNIPEYSLLKECIFNNNYCIKSAEGHEERAAILLQIAKSEKIPDVDLGFGVRQFEEDNSYTFVAGLSVPLPLFNRNQGGIQESLINKDKVSVDKKILVNDLLIQLNEYYKEFQISLQQVTSYKNSLLPGTQEYYDLTVNSYEKGSLPYLDVLVAERNLVEMKTKYTEALCTLQNSVANLENLCAQHFHGINGEVF